jgi:tetratricopeptide (TPR) repeat protein
VNKDNLISAVFGILLGFIAGYLMHEVMASRQPPRFVAGGAALPQQAGPPLTGAPAEPQPDMAATQQAAMEEMRQLEQHIQQNPNDAQAIRRLADLNFDQAQWPQARDLYSRVLELQPGNADVISDLGVAYRGLKNYDRALQLFDEAQKLAPDHWQSRFNEAVLLGIDLGRYDEAQALLAELEKLQPGNPNVAQLAAAVEKKRNAA